MPLLSAAQVEALLASMAPDMACHGAVWASLTGIAGNHRDRMRLFGRIPERNVFLGRESSEEERAYLAAVKRLF